MGMFGSTTWIDDLLDKVMMSVLRCHGIYAIIRMGKMPTSKNINRWMNLNVWMLAKYGHLWNRVHKFISYPWDRWKYRELYKFNWKKELNIK